MVKDLGFFDVGEQNQVLEGIPDTTVVQEAGGLILSRLDSSGSHKGWKETKRWPGCVECLR